MIDSWFIFAMHDGVMDDKMQCQDDDDDDDDDGDDGDDGDYI